MSKPGFPRSGTRTRFVENHYVRASDGHVFDGVDLHDDEIFFEDKDGTNTPGWPHAVRGNNYVRLYHQILSDPMQVDGSHTNGDTLYGEYGSHHGDGSYDPWVSDDWSPIPEVSNVYNKIVNKLINQLQANRVNSGEIIHTRDQAQKLLASTANRFASTLRALRRGNFVGAAKFLTGGQGRPTRTNNLGLGIPEQWLALRYGWQPMLQDIYNSVELVKKLNSGQADVYSVTANAGSKPSFRDVPRSGDAATYPNRTWTMKNASVRGNGTIYYRVNSEFGEALSQFGLTNPLSLAWELLPYSFVLDWMLPIGSYLESLDYARGLEFDRGWVSIKAKVELAAYLSDSLVSSGGYTLNWSGGRSSAKYFRFERFILGGFPSPPVPHLKNPFSSTHVANALSLLAAAFGRR